MTLLARMQCARPVVASGWAPARPWASHEAGHAADRLAAPDARAVWELAVPIDYDAERDRLKRYWGRLPGDADTGDFEP